METCKKCATKFNSKFCPQCGTPSALAELAERARAANNENCSAEAEMLYREILESNPEYAEAHWGLFIIDYGVKDDITIDGPFTINATAENFICNDKEVDDELYNGIKSNKNYLNAVKYASGDFKERIDVFTNALEDRYKKYLNSHGRQKKKQQMPKTNPAISPSTKEITVKTKSFSFSRCISSLLFCLPLIIELLFVFLIPKIPYFSEKPIWMRFSWNMLENPIKVMFLCLMVLGFGLQILGFFKKLNRMLAACTQLVCFLLFCLSAYATYNGATSFAVMCGMAVFVPLALIIATIKYLYGYDYNFAHFIALAVVVAEYILMFLCLSLMYHKHPLLWVFIVMTVITGLIMFAIFILKPNFPWVAMGINLGASILVSIIYAIVINFKSIMNVILAACGGVAGVIIVVLILIYFIHWYIHRDDIY